MRMRAVLAILLFSACMHSRGSGDGDDDDAEMQSGIESILQAGDCETIYLPHGELRLWLASEDCSVQPFGSYAQWGETADLCQILLAYDTPENCDPPPEAPTHPSAACTDGCLLWTEYAPELLRSCGCPPFDQ